MIYTSHFLILKHEFLSFCLKLKICNIPRRATLRATVPGGRTTGRSHAKYAKPSVGRIDGSGLRAHRHTESGDC